MKNPETIPRAIGTYPQVTAKADTAVGAKDGMPLHKIWVDDLLGAFQAILNGAEMTPSGSSETCGATSGDVTGSQIVEALQLMLGTPGEIVAWPHATIPSGCRLLPLDGDAVSLTTYPRLANVYCGNTANPTAPAWYKCTDPANPSTSRSTSGGYIKLADFRGFFVRGYDPTHLRDPHGDTREFGDQQSSEIDTHSHSGLALADTTTLGRETMIPQVGTVTPIVEVMLADAGDTIYTGSTGLGIGDETRPVNQIVQWCVRY